MKTLTSRARLLAAILACGLAWLAAGSAWAVERGVLPMATDLSKLAKEAKERRAPILVLFSSAGCHYCGQVRDEFLIPTTRNADYDNKVIMVEVEAGSSLRLIDFNGKATTHGDFAARYQITMTPTVKLLDAQGREAAIPLVGIVSRDYYGGFLDQAIDAALVKIRGGSTTAINP
jgi:thioredoxin-related protein